MPWKVYLRRIFDDPFYRRTAKESREQRKRMRSIGPVLFAIVALFVVAGVPAIRSGAAPAPVGSPSSSPAATPDLSGVERGAAPAPSAGGTLQPILNVTPSHGVAPLGVTATVWLPRASGSVAYNVTLCFGSGVCQNVTTWLGGAPPLSWATTYSTAGSYTVAANVTASNGSAGWANATVSVTLDAILPELTVTPNTGFAPVHAYVQLILGFGSTASPPFSATICPNPGSCVNRTQWVGYSAWSVVATYTSAGTYTITAQVNDSNGTSATVNATVTVIAPYFELVADPSVGSAPLTVNLTARVDGGAAPYNMTICSTVGSCATNASVNSTGEWTSRATYTIPGNYSVTASYVDAYGVQGTASTVVDVTAAAALTGVATAQAQPTPKGTTGALIGYTVNVSGGTPPYRVQWSYGDGTVGSGIPGQPTFHLYAHTGTFIPKLVVRDAVGHTWNETLPTVTVGATTAPTPPFGVSFSLGGEAPAIIALAVAAVALLGVIAHRLWVLRETEESSRFVYRLTQAPVNPDDFRRPP